MITLPEFEKAFDYENDFYLSCGVGRISKGIAHYELFKQSLDLSGAIVECGVFKGCSLSRFACYREFFGGSLSKKIIGFDTFDTFPETMFDGDLAARDKFIQDAGAHSISVEQLKKVLLHKGVGSNIDLVAGDICETVPAYVKDNPGLRISMLNIDTDIYEPAVTILEHLYPLLVPGGILILDDYGVFPGETKAVDEYFSGQNVQINKLPFASTPSYIIKK